MNKEYLFSIIDLYLKKEDDFHQTNLNISKNEQEITFSFNMNQKELDKTYVNLPIDAINDEIINIINIYKENLMIIDEKYNDNHYSVLFKSGRMLSFDGFKVLEINNIRNILYDININSSEMRLNDLNKEPKLAYEPKLTLQQAGFASFTTLFLVALFLTDIFIIALWIFKALTK